MKKVALITGASKGIGAATAKLLAAQGYAVCVNYHSSSDAAETIVKDIKKNNGIAISVKANIGNESDILNLFETIDKELGPVSALVNNAGINGGICKVENITSDCLETVFATNVFGTFYCCREAVKRMKQHGKGSIVNISSEAGKFGGTDLAHYAASKAAINTFTIGLAREVASYNIRVNTVSPGVIDTEMHAASSPDRIANLVKSLPMGRMGTPEEAAKMIAWLLSDEASYISGTSISVTGAR